MPEGQGGVGAPTPGIGSSPFRPLLSLVRTGRHPVPTAWPPQLCSPGGSGRMLGNKSEPETRRDRDAERHRQIQRGKVQSKASTEAHCEASGPWAYGNHERMGSGRSGSLLDFGSPTELPPKQTMAKPLCRHSWWHLITRFRYSDLPLSVQCRLKSSTGAAGPRPCSQVPPPQSKLATLKLQGQCCLVEFL